MAIKKLFRGYYYSSIFFSSSSSHSLYSKKKKNLDEADESELATFRKEIEIMSKFSHPKIVQFLGVIFFTYFFIFHFFIFFFFHFFIFSFFHFFIFSFFHFLFPLFPFYHPFTFSLPPSLSPPFPKRPLSNNQIYVFSQNSWKEEICRHV